jgi:hypothetical protein
MTNPKRRHRRHNRHHYRSRARNRRRSNPFMSTRSRRHRNYGGRRRRRNPGIGGFSGTELLSLGLGAAGGAIGTRYLTQAILGDKNTGFMGYGTNLATAIALAWAAHKFVGREIAAGVVAGGIGSLLMRLWSEKVSLTSPTAMSGYLGDIDFSGDGLGAYIASGFPLPTVSGTQGNYLQIPAGASWGPAMAPAGAAVAPQGSGAPNVAVQPGQPAGLARFGSRF